MTEPAQGLEARYLRDLVTWYKRWEVASATGCVWVHIAELNEAALIAILANEKVFTIHNTIHVQCICICAFFFKEPSCIDPPSY